MKKTIKINFKDFFEGFDPERNYFTDTLREMYEVEISDNPDYMFYSVYPEVSDGGGVKNLSGKGDMVRKISPKLYVLLRKLYVKSTQKERVINHPKGDFVKILYATEGVVPDMSQCDYAFSSHPEGLVTYPNYFRIPMHLICDYPYHKKTRLPYAYEAEIDLEKVKAEKTKFCNFLYSQDINERNNFFKRLSKYKHIDSPGRCMNNMPPVSNDDPRASRVSKDWVDTKLEFLKPYKFTIAFENETKDGWTTEKLTHPMLVNSIPIYIGNERVGRDFNTERFINFSDFKGMKEFIEYIIRVDTNDELYRKYLEQPIFNTQKQHYFASHKRVADKLKEIIESKK